MKLLFFSFFFSSFLDSFCWIHSTYSVLSGYNKKVGYDVPYPGVVNRAEIKSRKDIKTHKYYQWTVTCLILQVDFYTFIGISF